MEGVDRHALEAGPANVYFDGVSLGYLGEDVMLNIATRVTELKGAQAGDTPLDAVVSGAGVTVEVPLAEISVSKFAVGLVNAIRSGMPTGTLTSSGVQVTDGDTVVIGDKTYTFQSALTPLEGEVLMGATAAASLLNLVHAINKSGGVAGTDYSVALPHPLVSAAATSATVLTLTPKASTGDAIATTKTAATLTWTAATLTPGVGLLTFKNRVGLSVRTLSKELRIVKIKGGEESTDPNDIFVFPEASPAASETKIPFHPTQQRLITVTFMVWPSDAANEFGTMGEAAA